jgi:glycine cleavage system H lipoate-binding protein
MNVMKRCFLIPPDEQICIWMAAGVLSYQLCNRDLDCDHCPVDAMMHGSVAESPAVEGGDKGQTAPRAVQAIPDEGLRYSRNHLWARKMASGHFRLGLESGLAQALLAVKGIVFPSPHQRLRKGRACIWVVMDGGTLALESPLDGAIRTVNHDLIEKPHLLSRQPLSGGWLCEVECEDAEAEVSGMLNMVDIRPKYSMDRSRFLASLSCATRGRHAAAGITPADGDERLRHTVDILGPIRYIAVLRQHFGRIKRR